MADSHGIRSDVNSVAVFPCSDLTSAVACKNPEKSPYIPDNKAMSYRDAEPGSLPRNLALSRTDRSFLTV
jgi:hypothetical protein